MIGLIECFGLLSKHNLWFNVSENSLIYNCYGYDTIKFITVVKKSSSSVNYYNENPQFSLIILQLLTTFPSNLEVNTLVQVE